MPTNLYGPGDSYHSENSHVIPALIRRFYEAKESGADSVAIWGLGNPRREFLYVDDLALACVHVMRLEREQYDTFPMQIHPNVGYGDDFSILELAETFSDVTGFQRVIDFDTTKPDGTPRKLMDSSRIRRLGWSPSVCLKDGLSLAYVDFVEKQNKGHLKKCHERI